MAKALQDIWQDVLAVIRDSVPAERFNLWFRNTELLSQEGGHCQIGVPNAFVADWLQEHFGDVVKGAQPAAGWVVESLENDRVVLRWGNMRHTLRMARTSDAGRQEKKADGKR